MKDGLFVDEFGTKAWYKEGKIHREDGPAVIYTNGDKFWYKEGEIHRESGPAVEYEDGTKVWYKEGEIHRESEPAVEWADATTEWWVNGEKVSTHLPDDKNINECCEKFELDIKPTKYLTDQIVI